MYEQGLAGPQPGHVDDVGPDRTGDLGQGAGLGQADRGRLRQQVCRGYGDLLRVPAATEQGAHLVAGTPVGHVVGDGPDGAGALQTRVRRRAGRWRVEALALEEIGPVDGGGGHVDQYLAGAQFGIGYLGPTQDLGTAWLTDRHRVHVG